MRADISPSAAIEIAAEAMYLNRFGGKHGPWLLFKLNHEDMAEIYRENARVALKSVGVIPVSH